LEAGPRFNVIAEVDGALLIETQIGAPRGRVVRLDCETPNAAPVEVVAESADAALAIAAHSTWSPLSGLAGGRLFLTYVRDAAHTVVAFDLDGCAAGETPLPSPCTVLQLASHDDAVEVAITGFLSPWESHIVDPVTLAARRDRRVEPGIPIAAASCRQIFCESRDGTRVPAFVVTPRSDPGPLPTLLYVYGGWGQSITPSFRPDLALWVTLGGAYVVANARGGGEYGEAWHRAGMRLNKINTFDDCIAITEALIEDAIAAPGTLCIRGLSNGGLVTAACVNLRPELFAAACCTVPLVDVVHLMQMPAGSSIASEFGDPTADRATFDYLLSYSPLQNIHASPARPDMLVIVGERDERAPPAWTYRYVAELQATASPGQTVLLEVVAGEAHGGWPPDVDRRLLEHEVAFLWDRATAHANAEGDA
jgi:prolyl oligopeptidase